MEYQDVSQVWPDKCFAYASTATNNYFKHGIKDNVRRNLQNNFTIITSNLPVNNTVRFETDYRGRNTKLDNVRLQ